MRSTSGSGTCSRRRARGRAAAAAALALAIVAAAAPAATAKVFHNKTDALALAFPDADRIESRTFVLDDEQVRRIQELARAPLDSKVVTVHTGWRGDAVLGFAVIDVHDVRTLPEAFMVVLTPDGRVRSLRILAFHEPLDYLPPQRWYDQFEGKDLDQPLKLGDDVHGVIGATLSARATTNGVRRALALYRVLLAGEASP
jgi:hypothetical protein